MPIFLMSSIFYYYVLSYYIYIHIFPAIKVYGISEWSSLNFYLIMASWHRFKFMTKSLYDTVDLQVFEISIFKVLKYETFCRIELNIAFFSLIYLLCTLACQCRAVNELYVLLMCFLQWRLSCLEGRLTTPSDCCIQFSLEGGER